MNSTILTQKIESTINSTKVFYAGLSNNTKKYVAYGLVGAIVIGIVNPFGIFDNAETAKNKRITANNAELTSVLEKAIIDRDNSEKEIASLNSENNDLSKKIVTKNEEICGLAKQFGSESLDKTRVCSQTELQNFTLSGGYDAVADYVSKYIKSTTVSLAVDEAKASNDTNSGKTVVAVSTGTIDPTTLAPGDKIINGIVEHKYTGVDSLFYGTNVLDKCYVSQSEKDHFKSNGRIATDIACAHKQVFIHAPDYKNQEIKYTVKVVNNWDTGESIELYFKSPEDGADYHWLLGHTSTTLKDGAIVKTGEVIGLMNLTGITEGYHLHQELWQGGNQVSYKIINKVLQMRVDKK